MPTIFREGPYRFSFYSNERDEPPHVHVERDDATAKYWLVPAVALIKSDAFRAHELTKVEKIVREHREEWVQRWNEYFNL